MRGDAQSDWRAFRNLRRAIGWAGGLLLWLTPASFSFAQSLTTLQAATKTDRSADIRISNDQRPSPPLLVFACDGSVSDLEKLFSEPGVLSDLEQLHAGVSVATPELSAERAALVQMLNHAGIPVRAGLSLPAEQGYYVNADNAREAAARFRDFENWTQAYGLHWAAIGLDIEPKVQDFDAIRYGSKWRVARILVARYFVGGHVQRARESYNRLIRRMQAGGYTVETYQFPFIADERKVHSTLLERLSGIVDVRGDREALMVYTSFHPALDSALIWEYGPEAQAIIIGTTVGPENNPHFAPLHWDSFLRDLLVAHHFSDVIGVYNLEGCVRQGFLGRLKTLDWDQSVAIPGDAVRKAEVLRSRIQRAIWIATYLPYFMVALLLAAILLVWQKLRRTHSRGLRESL